MKQELLKLLKEKAYQKKEVVLSSGRKSGFYIDVRKVSLTAKGIYLIANLFFRHFASRPVEAIGGPSLGADPLVAGVCFLAAEKKKNLSGFLIRKSPKKHGRQKLIEGPLIKKGSKVILCDDVATSGNSLIKAKEVVEDYGWKVEEVMVVVDREEGAGQALAGQNCNLFSLYKKSDFLKEL